MLDNIVLSRANNTFNQITNQSKLQLIENKNITKKQDNTATSQFSAFFIIVIEQNKCTISDK